MDRVAPSSESSSEELTSLLLALDPSSLPVESPRSFPLFLRFNLSRDTSASDSCSEESSSAELPDLEVATRGMVDSNFWYTLGEGFKRGHPGCGARGRRGPDMDFSVGSEEGATGLSRSQTAVNLAKRKSCEMGRFVSLADVAVVK